MVYESLPVIIHLAALVVIVILVVVSELVDVVGSLALRSLSTRLPLVKRLVLVVFVEDDSNASGVV